MLVNNIIYMKSTSQTYLLSTIGRGTLCTRVHVTAWQNLVAQLREFPGKRSRSCSNELRSYWFSRAKGGYCCYRWDGVNFPDWYEASVLELQAGRILRVTN